MLLPCPNRRDVDGMASRAGRQRVELEFAGGIGRSALQPRSLFAEFDRHIGGALDNAVALGQETATAEVLRITMRISVVHAAGFPIRVTGSPTAPIAAIVPFPRQTL